MLARYLLQPPLKLASRSVFIHTLTPPEQVTKAHMLGQRLDEFEQVRCIPLAEFPARHVCVKRFPIRVLAQHHRVIKILRVVALIPVHVPVRALLLSLSLPAQCRISDRRRPHHLHVKNSAASLSILPVARSAGQAPAHHPTEARPPAVAYSFPIRIHAREIDPLPVRGIGITPKSRDHRESRACPQEQPKEDQPSNHLPRKGIPA